MTYLTKITNLNALKLLSDIQDKVSKEMEVLLNIPVSVLIWGPNPDGDSEFSKLRLDLRDTLNSDGHLAQFSEELIVNNKISIRIQQLIHAQKFDLIVSLPSTPGTIGEIHDFATDRRVNNKLKVFLNTDFSSGYSFQSLSALCSVLTYGTVYYNGYSDIDTIKESIYSEVNRIREIKYFYEGRI